MLKLTEMGFWGFGAFAQVVHTPMGVAVGVDVAVVVDVAVAVDVAVGVDVASR